MGLRLVFPPNPLWKLLNHSYMMVLYHGQVICQMPQMPVKILRDTGASQSLLLADALPFSEESYAGANVLVKGVDSSDYTPVPLYNVYLSSNLVSGPVTLGIRPSLPFDGVHLLLGNDLTGDKVVINPVVTENPCLNQSPGLIEKEIPG